MSLDEFLDRNPPQPQDGIGLALSGGGYRAMVFHVGALIRLNETALLRKVKRISSVSGGSITAGVLGMSWKDLAFAGDVATNFDIVVAVSGRWPRRQWTPARSSAAFCFPAR